MKNLGQFLMQKLKNILFEFVYGGHLLSLGASGIVLSVILVLNLDVSLLILVIAYLISQVVYTYNHFRELEFDIESNPERAKHLHGQKNAMMAVLFSYLVILVAALLFTNVTTFLFILFIVIGGILYTEYFKNVNIIGFKNLYTSFFWSILIFSISTFYNIEITLTLVYLFLFTFLRWIVNSAFFDIKDITSDAERNIKTLAVSFGKYRTIAILLIINLISIIPILLGVYTEELPDKALLLLAFSGYGLYYLIHAIFLDGKQLRNLSYIVVDAEYIFWPLVILIGEFIF